MTLIPREMKRDGRAEATTAYYQCVRWALQSPQCWGSLAPASPAAKQPPLFFVGRVGKEYLATAQTAKLSEGTNTLPGAECLQICQGPFLWNGRKKKLGKNCFAPTQITELQKNFGALII
jgi:hypothetical protein